MRRELTIQEYHDDKLALSSSGLSYLNLCPAKYKAYQNGAFKITQDALTIGQAVHTLFLEPEKFDSEFILGKGDGRSAEAKKAKKKLQEGEPTKLFLSPSQFKLAQTMVQSIKDNEDAMNVLTDGEVEQSFFWEERVERVTREKVRCLYCRGENDYEEKVECIHCHSDFDGDAVLCKSRPDFFKTWNDSTAPIWIVDIKTTSSIEEFSQSIDKYNYDMQAYFQMRALEQEGIFTTDYYWVVVEKTIPYLVRVLKASKERLYSGREKFKKNLPLLRQCIDNNSWPGYEGVIEI